MKIIFSVGIDIGGTNTDIGLVDSVGNCVSVKNIKTEQYDNAEKYAEDLVQTVKLLMEQQQIDSISGIGIGAPCVNFNEQIIDNASNLKMKGKIHLKSLIQKHLNTEVVLANDANAAAQGEMIYGGAKGMKNFIMITLGTGVGSGIVIDGKILHGADGFAGELGHSILIPEGRTCSCGRKGCLEMYVSSRGILQTFRELTKKYPENILCSLPNLECKQLSEEARKGNPLALETYRKTGYYLGIALANAVNFSSPEAFFLMGGPVKAGNILLEPLRESFNKHKLFVYKKEIPILESSLNANYAAILGAAALTRKNYEF